MMIFENDGEGNEAALIQERLARYAAAVQKLLRHERKKLEKQLVECAEAEKWPWYRQIGDSLLADPSSFPRGTGETPLHNVHTDSIEIVKLNTKLAALENAQLFYKKAKKGERGLAEAQSNRGQTERTIARLHEIAGRCAMLRETFPDPGAASGELAAIETELVSLGALPPPLAASAGAKPAEKVPYRHLTIDGYDIFIGKNETQNDELSTRFTKPWDIWMHVVAQSGSHVVVKREKNAPWPPQEVLTKAAALTVWFSKAKHTSYAEVHVTEGRFVHKRHKSPPGQVIAERCKTIRVAPKSPKEIFGEDQQEDP
jgi:predicted ribosome quality control (RQC) complex YloA/Tae2 family protein